MINLEKGGLATFSYILFLGIEYFFSYIYLLGFNARMQGSPPLPGKPHSFL